MKEYFCGMVADMDGADEFDVERHFWVDLIKFFAIVAFIAGVLSMLPGCATVSKQEARSVYDGPPMVVRQDEGNMVRLTNEPCPNVLGWLAMSRAEMLYQGKPYEACWLAIFNTILVFDSNGDVTPLPAAAFRQESGV